MIPAQRFGVAHNGKVWICQNEFCQKTNKAGVYQCVNCNTSIPPSELAADLIFKRFRYEQPDPNVVLFRDVLSVMPLIEEHVDFKNMLETELQIFDENKDRANANPGGAAQGDIHQQSKLYQFKQVLDDYIFRNKAKAILQVQKIGFGGKLHMDEQNKLSSLLTQNTFLDQLSSKTVHEIEVKTQHQALLRDYQAALAQINQLKTQIKQRSVLACQELDAILYNSYRGLSSEFLKIKLKKMGGLQDNNDGEEEAARAKKSKFQETIWAGRLHINEKQEKMKQASARSGKAAKKEKSDRLQDYFKEIGDEAAQDYGYAGGKAGNKDKDRDGENEIDEEARAFERSVIGQATQAGAVRRSERSLVGTFKFTNLQQSGVIKKADSIKYDFQVLRDSQFVFNDDGKGGFHVELIYKEPPKLNV